MNFFKKLFSSKGKEAEQQGKSNQTTNFQGIGTNEYFEKRYQEDFIDESILDGSLKTIESYFIDNKIERKVKDIVNHPVNLDQAVNDGLGFHMYCQAFKMNDGMVVGLLVMAFNDFMIKNLDFKLYKDNEPEFPMRSMTLKYDKEGAVLSLYPIEYALKVLNYEATFEDLYDRINTNLKNMPTANEFIDKLTNNKE